MGLGILFHLYAVNVLSGFFYTQYSLFFFPVQVTGFLLSIILFFMFSSDLERRRFGIIFLVVGAVLLFVYFYYGTAIFSSEWFRFYKSHRSSALILNWDFYCFLVFFFGWVFKVGKKYTNESYTKGESFLFRSLLPSIVFFEGFTFVYLMIWRYLNTTMAGQSIFMFLKAYKTQFILSSLIPKLFFFLGVLIGLQVLVMELKRGNILLFLVKYFVFILVVSLFLFLEFREFWAITHMAAVLSLAKFTYFKFFAFIVFFNFFHAYLVVLINYVFIVILVFKHKNYYDFYDLIYINFKLFSLIMWLIYIVFISIYIIHDLFVFIPKSFI